MWNTAQQIWYNLFTEITSEFLCEKKFMKHYNSFCASNKEKTNK